MEYSIVDDNELTCRLSELAEASRTHKALDTEPENPRDGSPRLTPRSKHAAPSDEEEQERPQARRKKTGDEPSSRQPSPTEQAEVGDFAEDETQHDPTPIDGEDELVASQGSGMTLLLAG